jgi:hypothetical protein
MHRLPRGTAFDLRVCSDMIISAGVTSSLVTIMLSQWLLLPFSACVEVVGLPLLAFRKVGGLLRRIASLYAKTQLAAAMEADICSCDIVAEFLMLVPQYRLACLGRPKRIFSMACLSFESTMPPPEGSTLLPLN